MLKHLLRIFVASLLALAVLFAAAFGFVQTGFARQQIESALERSLSSDTVKAEVSGLGGLLPFSVRLEKLRLSDERGTWLEVEEARADLSPTALLAGSVAIRELSAKRVAIARLPERQPPSEPSPKAVPELPALPESLPAVRVDRLALPHLELGAPLLGEPAVFALTGGAAVSSDGRQLDARFALERIDQPTAHMTMGLFLDLDAQSLDLNLKAEERGRLFAILTGLERAQGARLELEGKGPLAQWHGSLSAVVERVGALEGRLALDVAGLPGVEATLVGAIEPEGIPEPYRQLLGERPEATLALLPEGPSRLRLAQLRLALAALSLEGSGTLDLEADRIEARIAGSVPDLAPFQTLIGEPLLGRLHLDATAEGTLSAPTATARLAGESLRVGRVAAQSLTLEFTTNPTPAELEPRGLLIALEGQIEGTTVDGAPLEPEGRILLDGEAILPPEGPLSLAALRFRGAGLEAWLAGQIDPRELVGELGYGVRVPELETLALLLGPPGLRGALEVQGVARLAGLAKIEGEIAALAFDLAEGPVGLRELIGRGARLDGRFTFAGDQLHVDDLLLRAEHSEVRGAVSLRLADQRLAGTVRVAVPQLETLAQLVGTILSGSAVVETRLAGTLYAPELTLSARFERPAVAALRFDRLQLDGTLLPGPKRTALRLEGAGQRDGAPVRIALQGDARGEQLNLERFELLGLGTIVSGNASVDLSRPLVSGRIRARSEDLAQLSALGLVGLSGTLELDIEATPEAGAQSGRLHLSAAQLGAPFGQLASARLEIFGRDLFRRGTLAGEATVEGFRSAEIGIDRGRVSLDGSIADVGFALEVQGARGGQAMALQASGRLAALSDPRRLELAKLTGQIGGQTIELRQPARIVLDKGVLDLGTLDLKIGEASARTRASLGAGQIRAEAVIEGVSAATLRLLNLPEIPGRGRANLTLMGPMRGPEARVDFFLDVLRPSEDGVSQGKVEGHGALRGGREFSFIASGTGLGPQPIVVELRLPVRIDLEAMNFHVDSERELFGSARGSLDLGLLDTLLRLDGQSLGGRLDIDLQVDGRIGAPTATGTIQLAQGQFRDAESGLRLRGLKGSATARRDRLVLETLEARDRGEGRLFGSGAFSLSDLAWQLRLEAKSFRAFANEWGTAVVSGALDARGIAATGRIAGNLVVERAELRLPAAAPSVPPTIPVHEVGRGARSDSESRQPPARPIAFNVTIDAPQRFFLRGRGLDSEWGGSVRVRGDLFEPDIVGRLEVKRGHLDLLGIRFRLAEGGIEFDGARPPWPTLSVRGEVRRADITARVGITGRLPKIAVGLESDPPLPQEEVLARLFYNRDLSRLAPLQAAALANSLATLQGGGLDALSPVRAAVGLDTLDVGGTEDGGAALRAGKYVSERIYVEVQRGLTPETSRARVEVDLGYNLRGTTEVRETGTTGFGLEWRYDY